MEKRTSRLIQLVFGVALVAAGIRLGMVWLDRYAARSPVTTEKKEVPLEGDYYVTPKKLHAYDLKSARDVMLQPVWVREGYRYSYFPYDRARHYADLEHQSGQLGPIERLEIKDVVLAPTPGKPSYRQVLAVFENDARTYAFPIGIEEKGSYQIYIDEMLYIQDPHDLYKHWAADVWQAVANHEVKPGMNELQAAFAVGMGIPRRDATSGERAVDYPNGGRPLVITYRSGRAVSVAAASAASP